MGSKFDQLVKDRIAKTGEKVAMAVRNVRLQEQQPNFPVVVGQMPAVASGVDPVAVSKRAEELARNPLYFAGTGGEEHLITREEHDRLIGRDPRREQRPDDPGAPVRRSVRRGDLLGAVRSLPSLDLVRDRAAGIGLHLREPLPRCV